MLLAFGLVLAVFGATIFVMWTYLDRIKRENEFISGKVIPAQELCSNINVEVDALFIALHIFRTDQTMENVEAAKRWIAAIQKTMREISAFYADAPEVDALAHQVNEVFPRLNAYFRRIEDCVAATFRKNELYDSMGAIGGRLSSKAQNFRDTLREHYRQEVTVIEEAADIMIKLEETRRFLHSSVLGGNVAALNSLLRTLEENTGPSITALRDRLDAPDLRRMADDISAEVKNYQNTMREFIAQYIKMEDIVRDRTVMSEAIDAETKGSVKLTQERVAALSQSTLQKCCP